MSARECPWCKSWEEVLEHHGTSEAGDFMACGRCLNPVVLQEDGTLRRATGGELQWLWGLPDVRASMIDAHVRRRNELGAMIQ